MKVEVLNTGTELLLGNVVNTHAAYFGRALFPLGLRLARQTAVPDGAPIRDAFIEAFPRCDVLLVTGGLGPTTDDVTRELAAELLGRRLVEDDEILRAIQERCARRGFAFQERMRRQTMVPEGATVLPNAHGTAPGLYLPPFETPAARTPHLFLLPGPPRELKPVFEGHVLPRLRDLMRDAVVAECRVYRCVGIGESLVESRIGLRLSEIAGLEVGYCARPNEVDLRLIGASSVLDEVEPLVLAELGEFIISRNEESLESVVVAKLRAQRRSLAIAESCTGGLLANRITDVPGASEVFGAGWVTYANEMKTAELGVDAALIAGHGAVSEPVARQMAEGARERAGADFGLATTGIAGPGGGTGEKPVGTVFLALAERGRPTLVWREFFPTDRGTFKDLATQAALSALRKRLDLPEALR
ncbi:MAG: competence/damage-inducible protein A [Terrimicrobiaceae bacterium]|nr:competence/damage-inducible protein A [Terrimicrobiaceae bacterium]